MAVVSEASVTRTGSPPRFSIRTEWLGEHEATDQPLGDEGCIAEVENPTVLRLKPSKHGPKGTGLIKYGVPGIHPRFRDFGRMLPGFPFRDNPFLALALGETGKGLDILVWSTFISKEVAMMLITNISEAKAQLSSLIEKVRAGENVIIGKAGKPVAMLVKYEKEEVERRPGALKGRIKIEENFDELPPDIAKAFGMEDS